MTDELIAFLRARLAEDEQTARDAGGVPWEGTDNAQWIHVRPEAIRNETWRLGHLGHVATVEHNHDRSHILRYDPARVLRDVEAKRRIIDAAVATWNNSCDPTDEFWVGLAPMMKSMLKHLATVWSDHPDFDEGWRP